MKLEIGGGNYAKDGFQNMDLIESADIQWDMNRVPWPIEADSVTEVYSSHCLEHLECPISAFRQIARVCVVGASVVIRVPDCMSEGAMIAGHRSVITETMLRNLFEHFPDDGWKELKKCLKIESITPRADPTWFPRARSNKRFANWTDSEILDFVPRTCHEREFQLTVIPWT